MQCKKEIYHMLELSYVNYVNGYGIILGIDKTKGKELADIEDQIDYINKTGGAIRLLQNYFMRKSVRSAQTTGR